MSAIQEIKMIAETLRVGEQRRITCPVCTGNNGLSPNSMRICRYSDAVYARCYRAVCGFERQIGMVRSLAGPGQVKPQIRHYYKGTRRLTENERKAFEKKYGMEVPIGWQKTEHGGLYMPVRGPKGEDRGVQVKGDAGRAKQMVYSDTEVILHWPWFTGSSKVIIAVEDIISAEKVASCGYRSVALQGTSLDYGSMKELRSMQEWSGCPVLLHLDKDARIKALQKARDMLGLALVPVLPPVGEAYSRDPKYWTKEMFDEVYEELT